MDAKQMRIFKNFKRVLDERDTTLIQKALYEQLVYTLSMSAYYNMDSFRDYFSGRNIVEFMKEVKYATQHIVLGWHDPHPECRELHIAIREYLLEKYEEILFDLDDQKRNKEIEMLEALVQKYGYEITKRGAGKVSKGGQLTLC